MEHKMEHEITNRKLKSFPQFLKMFKEIKPLSNFDIVDMCKKLNIKNFKGVFMRDEIKGSPKSNECFIMNIDHSDNDGTHWTSLFVKNGVCYYFDSYGFPPPNEIVKYCDGYERYFNSFEIQTDDRIQILCGHYCIYILYLMDNGITFYDVISKLYSYGNLEEIFS